MSAADMDPTPSPTSNPDDICSGKDHGGKLAFATVLVVVGVLALFLLHVLGTLRRRSSHKLLHAIVLGTYTLSYLLVSYTLGLMQDSAYYFFEFPVWAVCLLMLLGGTDNLMACNLNDVDNWKSFHVKHLIKGVLVVGVVAAYGPKVPQYVKPLCAILIVNALQSYVRITSMRMASKSHLLWKNVKPIADYMKRADQRQLASGQQLTVNPITMEGYRYVVTGEDRLKSDGKKNTKQVSRDVEVEDMKITTVEEIWQCKGSLLCSERGSRLKDVCLSMALSKMLHRRFAGFELVEANLKKTKEFVLRGLLVGDEAYKRAFRVIEVELGFVYDLYYTRYPYLYYKGCYLAICLPVVMVLLCSWLTYQLLKTCKEPDNNFALNTSLTLGLMAVVTFLEAFQLYLHMASGWFKVALIRSYVRNPALLHGCFPRTIISLLLRLEAHRPWENKLGQYSLLQNYDCTRRASIFLHYVTLGLVNKAMKGCRRGKPQKVSIEVKQAVVDSLVRSDGHLTNGISSLRSNGVHEKLSWACDVDSDGKVTRTILVWHVATTICKHKLDAARPKKNKQLPELSKEDNTEIDTTSKVASSLSQYCAYLVAFSPDLLPGHSFDSVSMLEESIDEACELLKGAKTMGQKCDKLESIITGTGNDDPRLVVQGARLARQLTAEIRDKKLQWKVLADFWAEMILYVAPCDDALARAHLEALTRGGEFITHLWALLTHAGVLEREHVGPMSAV